MNRRILLRDWKYGTVRAFRTVSGVFIHSGDLMRVLGIDNPQNARNGLKMGKEREFAYQSNDGSYEEGVFFDETRTFGLLSRYRTPHYNWVRCWLRRSLAEVVNSQGNGAIIEIRQKKLCVRDRSRALQLECLKSYLESLGREVGEPFDNDGYMVCGDIIDGCNRYKKRFREWDDVQVTKPSVARDMANLGYFKVVKGKVVCYYFRENGAVGSED